MKILITGSAGFVGTNLTRNLLEDGLNVLALDSLSRSGTDQNLSELLTRFPKLQFIKTEIEDIPAQIYKFKPDIVFHFAAQVAVTTSVSSPLRDFKINAEGSFNIARAAADVGAKIIYTSTNKVYGNNVNNVEIMELDTRYDYSGNYKSIGLPETFSIDANHHTPYGISKLVGELYVREFGGIANRCSCMYGPNQFGIVDQGWMSHIATNKILGRETVIYGDGKQVRDALHITDVVNLMRKQMEALSGSNYSKVSGNAYNVGGGYANTISLIELCRLWEITPVFSSWRPADQKVFYCDVSRARQDFGWSAKVKLDHGLAELYAWTVSSLTNR
jgi:CDP-paratose 2-epimerase